MILVDTHLLASREGYTTFAKSSAVAPAEQRELEELVYGQPDDAEIYGSMATEAVAMLRRLRSTGRFALSRMLAGGTDSAGRETIAVCTMIMGPAEYQALARSDLWRLLHSTQLWSVDLFRKGQQLSIPDSLAQPRTVSSTDVALFDAWLVAKGRSNSVAVIGASSANHRAIVGLPQVIHPSDLINLTWGCRLLSIPSGVALASIAQRGVEQNSRRAVVAVTATPTTEAGKRALAVVGSGTTLPSSTASPVAPPRLAAPGSGEISVGPEPTQAGGVGGTRRGGRAGTGYGRSDRAGFEDPLAQFTSKRTASYAVAAALLVAAIVGAIVFGGRSSAANECKRLTLVAQAKAKEAETHAKDAKDAKESQSADGLAKAAEASAKEAGEAAKNAEEHATQSGWPFQEDATAARGFAKSAQESALEASKIAAQKAADATKAADEVAKATNAPPPPLPKPPDPAPIPSTPTILAETKELLAQVRSDPDADNAKILLERFTALTSGAPEKDQPEVLAMQVAASIAQKLKVATKAQGAAEGALKSAREFTESSLVKEQLETVSKCKDSACTAAKEAEADLAKTDDFDCHKDAVADFEGTKQAARATTTAESACRIAYQKVVAAEKRVKAETAKEKMKGAQVGLLDSLSKEVAKFASEAKEAADAAAKAAEEIPKSDESTVAIDARADAKAAHDASITANNLAADAKRSADAQGSRENGASVEEFDPPKLSEQIVDSSNKLFDQGTINEGLQEVIAFADRIAKQSDETIEQYVYQPEENKKELKEYGDLLFNVAWGVQVLTMYTDSAALPDQSDSAEATNRALAKLKIAFEKLAEVGEGHKEFINPKKFVESFFNSQATSISDSWNQPDCVLKKASPERAIFFEVNCDEKLGPIQKAPRLRIDKSLESIQKTLGAIDSQSIVFVFHKAFEDWIRVRQECVDKRILDAKNFPKVPVELPPTPMSSFDLTFRRLERSPHKELRDLRKSVAQLESKWDELKILQKDPARGSRQ